MEVILQTTDIVQISFVEMLLSSEGIPVYILDRNMSQLEGSINILPMRVGVLFDDVSAAKAILKDNGILTL